MTNAFGRPSRGGPYRRLIVWQRAKELAVQSYAAAAQLPPSERFELSPQIRRAAVSVVANIAESSGRRGHDRQHLLSIARGSLYELDALVELAHDLHLTNRTERFEGLVNEVGRMLTAMVAP